MHYSLNKTLKLPIRCQNLNKFACKYRFYWLSEGGPLFKLYRSRRFTGQIVEYTIDSFHLIDNPAHDFLQDFERNLCGFCGHEVDGVDGAERYGVVVGTFVSHDADRAHVGEGGEVLANGFVEAGVGDFFAVDGVGVLNDTDFFGGDFTDDADAETRTREWLTEDEGFREAQFEAGFADLVFEEVAERFDDFFEVYVVREAAHVVVGFDNGGFSAEAAFNDVRVDGSLGEEVHGTDFFGFFFEDADKFFADDLTFLFRLCDACQFAVIAFLSVDADEVQVKVAFRTEYAFYFVAFVFAEKAVIHEYAGQLFTDGAGKEAGCHGGVYAAG